MSIKAATKYQMNEYIKSVRSFYLVVISVIAFFAVISNISSSSNFVSTGGMEWSTTIFVFILGLNSFKEAFLMMLQNSTTRKTMFISRLGTILLTASFMSVIDRIIVGFAGLFNDVIDKFYISGMYEMVFEKRANSLHIVAMNLEAILIALAVYTVAMIGGYLITAAYYRMGKALKVIVSIGVPLSFFILLPLLDMGAFNGKLSIAMQKMLLFVLGGEDGNPYNLFLSCVLIAVVGVGLSWLLIRRAVEKN